ncbi:hypothetical protein KP509_12G008700 [Ceratopteris richardii]|uniref:non-specific serine/threonine protein kinase n=1 Tax=Ceratopteris richardii TaxID=49495 RepID=A0A8T2TL40_CERRI|nr:hypothetical protein KP509_12G008700 [Ceratopteris richardii]
MHLRSHFRPSNMAIAVCLREIQTFHLLVLLSWLTFALCNSSSTTLSDAEALRAIRDAWKLNQSWWQGDDPCNGWENVGCDTDNRVNYLNLSSLGIVGDIPDEIRNLDHLTILDLSNPRNSSLPYNFISGDLSPLQSLTRLLHLNLTFNSLQLEVFPSSIFNLTSLISLRLDNNLISGPLPKELAGLENLVYLYLGNNSLSGPIPKEYGAFSNLQELSLWNNYLNSTIPSEIGLLQNLRYLNLHDCSLYGGLPDDLARLRKLERMSLYSNQLTGEIPDAWRNLTGLQHLYLKGNYLTKSIPPWLFSLPKLYNLSLGYNLFYGDLNIKSTNISIISLDCNFLSGPEPELPNHNFTSEGNCFAGADTNDKIKCYQPYYDCSIFFERVPNGSCPSCPARQILYNASTCVCMIDALKGASSSRNTIKAIGSTLAVIVFALCMFFVLWRRSRILNQKPMKDFWEGPEGVQRFLYKDLSRATNDFDRNHEIGHGGFGKVYLGEVNGKAVAIKRAHTSSIQDVSGFRNEVVLLSRLHHRNLVRLLGFCEENETQILVYEYMPKGNLHTLLFNIQNPIQLDWLKRLDIALGVAQGLDYLHSFADPPVIHRDVKPSNILLDENTVAKLSDFGISKVTSEFETEFPTKPAGTVGYIDPQYILREQLTAASDVYSFGVVLLELVTGQKSVEKTRTDDQNLVAWVRKHLEDGGVNSIVDKRLQNNYPENVFHDMIRLAMDCASFDSENRPSMKVAVSILETCRWSIAPYIFAENDDSHDGSVYEQQEDINEHEEENLPTSKKHFLHSNDSVSASLTVWDISGR